MSEIRKLVFCLAVALMLSISVAAAQGHAAEGHAVEDIEILNHLGIMNGYENGKLYPERNITRMEFAAIICRCIGMEDLNIIEGEFIFPDVPADYWGAKYIATAKHFGLINGYENGNFGPYDLITVQDATKIIVRAIGYTYQAEKAGGYPTGYILTAGQLNLLDGITEYDVVATRGDISTMIVNCLEVKFIVSDSVDGKTTYFKGNETILNILGITKIEDVVTAVYGADLSGDYKDLEKDDVIIDNTRYKAQKPVDAAYIGLDSYIYIRDLEDDGKATVLLVLPRNINSVLKIESKDISSTTTLNKFVYSKDGKMRDVTLSEQLSIVYNGAALNTTSSMTGERLKPHCGTVTLIDSDNDNLYETAIVKEYETYVVTGIKNGAIYDLYGNNFVFDENDTHVTVIQDGDYIDFSGIKHGDVLSVAASLNSEKVEIIVSKSTVSGKVSTSYLDNERILYTLDNNDDAEYSISLNYKKAIDAGYSKAVEFTLGDEVVFYLNGFGEVAATEIINDEHEFKYGWLDSLYKDGALSKVCFLKIVTEDNKYEDFSTPLDKKVIFGRVEGSYKVTKVNASELIDALGVSPDTEKQLIKYKLNSNGEISELYLLDNKADSENFSKDISRTNNNFAYHIIENKYYYDENTVVMHIPSGGVYPERISAGHPSDYFANNKSYPTELYDIDDGYVNLIVYCATVAEYNDVYINYVNSPIVLITDIKSVSLDGDWYTVIEGYEDGRIVQRFLSPELEKDVTSGKLTEGLIIQYADSSELAGYALTSEDDVYICLYNVLMDCRKSEQENFEMWNYTQVYATNAKIKTGYGQVTAYDYPFIKTDNESEPVYEVSQATECYRFDSEVSQCFEKITFADIQQGDKIFIRTRYNYLKELVVVE